MVEEYRLPGGYFSTAVDEEETAWSSLPFAIVSSVLFPGNTGTMLVKKPHPRFPGATSLPGAWVQELIMEERPLAVGTARKTPTTTTTTTPPPPPPPAVLCGNPKNQAPIQEEVEEEEDTSEEAEKLRRTVAELRHQAELLEQTDRMVKKGLEIIAHKRVLAQHKRRRHSQWDWCDNDDDADDDGDESTSEEEEAVRTASRPKMSAMEEGDWVWIEEEPAAAAATTTRSKRNNNIPNSP